MKKIVFLINSLKIGGGERVVQTLANNLYADYEIHLVLLEDRIDFVLDSRIKIHILKKNNESNSLVQKFFSLFFQVKSLSQYLKKNNINFVQSHLFRANYLNIMTKMVYSSHYAQIVTHGLISLFDREGFKGKINKILTMYLYPHADSSIHVSKEVANELKYIEKYTLDKRVIYNPFDISEIELLSEESIDDFYFDNNYKYLIFVGRINKVKNIDLIFEALKVLDNKNIQLIILGDEEDVKIKDLMNKFINLDNIHYLGSKKNPYKYIKKCDVLILSSISESFGNVIVEAMACNTVSICSDCGGPFEILNSSSDNFSRNENDVQLLEYGLLFTVGDKRGLANAIKMLLSRKNNILDNYRNKLKKRVQDFDNSTIIQQYKDAIR
ncbi:glycosyltransferase [Candidatus Woesearchaeota archaeon]|nr:glycosyltransferase [Candidatus Woesearchaeota archaeon]